MQVLLLCANDLDFHTKPPRIVFGALPHMHAGSREENLNKLSKYAAGAVPKMATKPQADAADASAILARTDGPALSRSPRGFLTDV